MPAEVFWNKAALEARLDEALRGILKDFAEASANAAKANARVDTGFYKDHIVAVPPNSNGTSPDLQVLISRDGTQRSYYAPGLDSTGPLEALVAGQAEYSIYLELWDNTIFTAVLQTAAQIDGIASKHRL